ncbi:hypothetical protein RHECIAT_CH0000503 [Rhizobium etli CIAT 652]|uniref:Uncharacterized protein n=1 Tax=Rhizobium etli (strain CIAT 652) TaxID=491916 RepID=B3Q064_RHIE6|nr:hypothetical protein RHECIAT_CH0000503 [Rhizobium etli CIAT 652]
MMQTLAALLTPTIAAIAIVIAFMQWRTAHQKVMLDLFERRLKIYDQVHEVVAYFWTNEGNLVGFNAGRKLAAAHADARFMFGEEVAIAIEGLKSMVHQLSSLKNKLEKIETDGPEREKLVSQILDIEAEFERWPESFSKICLPYMRMDQKLMRTPAEWFRDKNRKRLSYGDQP